MATTTNYSWSTPDDTALVKDGASAIRTLGSSVDTTVKALNPETTLGDLAYRSSTANVKTRLGLGTAGQVLTVNSGANAPEWATVSSGGMTLISETTASALSSLSLSSIPGTYKQLLLVWQGIYHSTSGNFFNLRFNNNSSAGIYRTKQLAFSGNNVQSGNNSNTELYIGAPYAFGSEANWTTELEKMVKGYLIIDNYASSTKKKLVTGWVGYAETTEERWCSFVSTFNSTTAISSIDVYRAGGSGTFSNATDTSIRLYGIS
jgi:hypothetical protein